MEISTDVYIWKLLVLVEVEDSILFHQLLLLPQTQFRSELPPVSTDSHQLTKFTEASGAFHRVHLLPLASMHFVYIDTAFHFYYSAPPIEVRGSLHGGIWHSAHFQGRIMELHGIV